MDRKPRITTSIILEKSLYLKMRTRLLKLGKSFSKWIREKIIDELEKPL